MSNTDSEETRQEHLKVLGLTLGPLYHELYNEVVWIHAKWLEYRKLFAMTEERVEFLNKTASFFFYIIETTLWENVLLHIARLTDRPKMFGSENLTLLRLPDAVSDEELADDLRVMMVECLNRCQFARDWRDKRIAHNDLSLALDSKATPLPGVSRQNIEDALASFSKIMNRVYGAYFPDTEVGFHHFLARDDAELLVHYLNVAVTYEKQQMTRLHQGKSQPGDFDPIPEI